MANIKTLYGSDKLREAYPKVNENFNELNGDINVLRTRVNTIITTPIDGEAAAQELVDARDGESSLGERLERDLQVVESHLAENVTQGDNPHGLIYEEGTWTPSSDGATFDVVSATYTKIGNLIKLQCEVNVTVKGTSFVIRGIPFLGVSKRSYGTYINDAEPLATQQTYYARIDSTAGGRLGIFYATTSGAIVPLAPSVGTFFIDIIYNID